MSNQGALFPIGAKAPRGRYRKATDRTIVAMRKLGRVEPIDAALIDLCRGAADELDAATADPDESRYTRGTLIARYHAVLSHLLDRPTYADDSTDLDALLAALRDDRTGVQ